MNQSSDLQAKSSVAYWEEFWRRASGSTTDSYYWRRLDRSIARLLAELPPVGNRLLEVGVGGSEYLPYLHRRFGFEVCGLDYSETGCVAARALLSASQTPGEVRQADMFKPPADLVAAFDVVASFGLVEHFADTAQAVAACAAYLRPGGVIITVIPNMKGLYGLLYRVFNRAAYDTHVPLNLLELQRAHRACGLQDVHGEYLLGLPGVIDGARREPARLRRYLRRLVYRVSRVYWALEERGIGVPENAFSSPYMVCAARKP